MYERLPASESELVLILRDAIYKWKRNQSNDAGEKR